MREIDSLKAIVKGIGGEIEASMPNNSASAYYEAIIKKLGGTVDDLPDLLDSTYLKRIGELIGGGGSGGGGGKPATYTFIFDGQELTAEAGMCWGDWVNSEYNTVGLYNDVEDGAIIKCSYGAPIYYNYEGAQSTYVSVSEANLINPQGKYVGG